MLTQNNFVDGATFADLQAALKSCPDPIIAADLRAAIARRQERDPRPPATTDRLWHGNLNWLGWQFGPTPKQPYSNRWHQAK